MRMGSLRSFGIFVFLFFHALSSHALAADKLTFVTDFGFLGRHAYYFLALDKGYYREAGLDVTFVRGYGSADAIKQVAADAAQMGFADAATLILNRANDDAPVKLVSIVYSKPPMAFFMLANSGIRHPKDFEGKTIADTASSSLKILFPTYAKAVGIDPAKVKWTIIAPDARPGVLALGRADIVPDYIVGRNLLQKAAGSNELKTFSFVDAGLDFYSNGLIVSEKFLQEKPDVVRRFVKATFRGLGYSMSNPREAAEIMNRYHRIVDVDVAASELQIMASLLDDPKVPVGTIDVARLQKTIDLVSDVFNLKRRVSIESVSAAGFTEK